MREDWLYNLTILLSIYFGSVLVTGTWVVFDIRRRIKAGVVITDKEWTETTCFVFVPAINTLMAFVGSWVLIGYSCRWIIILACTFSFKRVWDYSSKEETTK